MRKLVGTLLAVVIAVAGVIALIAFFNARDDSTAADGTKTTVSASASADGNIVLTGAPADAERLRALAAELGAPDSPELREAGLAIIVREQEGARGVLARAGDERFRATGPDDPRLQEFIDRWLGQGSGG